MDATLAASLRARDTAGLRRTLRPAPAPGTLHGFASNDYLGLAAHPALVEAAARAARDFGAGATAARLIGGSLPPHHALEDALAAWKRTEAALAFGSGYATALGVIPALVGRGDFVVLDRLAHACCVDGVRLSGATLRVFRHNDPADLDRLLTLVRRDHGGARVLVVTEGVFSMDGDRAPLAELIAVKDRHGAWLMLDEAHAVGVFGPRGGGLAEELGPGPHVEVRMGTLGKAVGAAGGYVAGSHVLVDHLVNHARSFLFSTAPVPAAAAAAAAGVELIQSAEGAARRARLRENIRALRAALRRPDDPAASAIAVWPVGEAAAATTLAEALRDRGIFVPAIRYPTVKRGAARLRFTATAAHTADDFAALAAALAQTLFPIS
ncbi:MAG: aminotransferase class I/II-fold pyridoxal phosphate-dependent enzyme [Limisphaerales bacterium]